MDLTCNNKAEHGEAQNKSFEEARVLFWPELIREVLLWISHKVAYTK